MILDFKGFPNVVLMEFRRKLLLQLTTDAKIKKKQETGRQTGFTSNAHCCCHFLRSVYFPFTNLIYISGVTFF